MTVTATVRFLLACVTFTCEIAPALTSTEDGARLQETVHVSAALAVPGAGALPAVEP